MTTLTTDRLTLRLLVDADAAAYAAMRYHPHVARWLPTVDGDPLANAQRTIAHFAQCWASNGHGPWGLFLDTGDGEGTLIGHGGLRVIPEFDGQTELLYALHPDAWGKGYATELGRAALRFGVEQRGLASIFAITKPDNIASQAVIRRLGMSYRRRVTYKDIEAVWFDIDRATVMANRM